MKCEHCDQERDPEFSYNGHRFCCECMSELCSWFLDGGQVENPDQFAYVLDLTPEELVGTDKRGYQ